MDNTYKKIFSVMRSQFILFLLLLLLANCSKNEKGRSDILDTTLSPGTGVDDPYAQIHSVFIQADGRILIGGNFLSFNQATCKNLIRLNSNGTVDKSFKLANTFNWIPLAISLQQDGKVIVAGIGGTNANYITRLNSTGDIDPTFYPGVGFNYGVYSLAIQPDRKIIVGGDFTSFNGISRKYIARLNEDGTLDNSFNPGTGFNERVFSVNLQPDGKIVVGGYFTSYNGVNCNRIVRLNNDGSIDNSFNIGSGFDYDVLAVKLQPDESILVGGRFSNYNGTSQKKIVRLSKNGSFDPNFIVPAFFDGDITSMTIQGDGKIIIAGRFVYLNQQINTKNIERLNKNGTVDETYQVGTGFDNTVYTMALQNDGKLVCVGGFRNFNNTSRSCIARLNQN